MPPNSPQTLLSVEGFRQVISWQPFHFYQLANPKVPITDQCSPLVREYQWQRTKQAGRSDIRLAIQEAEQRLASLLNYDVGIRYRSEVIDPGYLKRISGPPNSNYWYGQYGQWYSNYGYPGWWRSAPALIQLQVGKLQSIGTVSYTQLVDSTTLVYSDTDGDGLNDTFTATFADSTSDVTQVIAAFSAADQVAGSASSAGSQEPLDWQIRPATVARLDGSTIKVVGPSWLLVKPAKYEGYYVGGLNQPLAGIDSSGAIDPDISANFVTGLTIWLKTYSSVGSVQYVQRYGTTEYSYDVPVIVIDAELGQLQLNLSGCCAPIAPSCYPGRMVEEIRINYEAGAPPQFWQGQQGWVVNWQQVVARYALAELQRPICSCEDLNQQVFYWQTDLAQTGTQTSAESGVSFRIANDVLNNPLGTKRGAVDAWRTVNRLAQHRAVNLG